MNGLTSEEVIINRKKYGTNALIKNKRDSIFKQFIISLGDPIIRILIIALAIKLIFLIKDFDFYETVGIVIAIFIASFISTISEYGSEKAFEKLQEESSKLKTKVKRNGEKEEIPVDEVVVNDIVYLESGDKIPADGIVLTGTIHVDESSLNGESKEKQVEKNDNVYRGSVVASGIATIKVKSVGTNTYYGKLASELTDKQPDSPLKIRLRELAKLISKIGYVGAFLVTFSYLFSVIVIKNNFDLNSIIKTLTNYPILIGHVLYALTLTVTVIVVAVPEGLPMMITLVLSSNMKRMLKNNVLVRKLVGIETAGSINILFTDKTGTLTNGKLEVTRIYGSNKMTYKKEKELKNSKLYDLIKLSFICNNDSTYINEKAVGGNITDRALINFFKIKNDFVKLDEIPFNSKNKYSIVKTKYQDKEINLIKGAPEIILSKCKYYYDANLEKKVLLDLDSYIKVQNNYTKSGDRVLALATYENDIKKIENLCFLGFACIKDTIRKEAKKGIEIVDKAHIKTIMITGDNVETAKNIAKEINLLKDGLVLTSSEINKMSDEEIKKILPSLSVLARSLPQDKSRLVRLSQEMGLVVGMTGDGVNDAPALKKADVGFAMGSGTEVSKEASDIVILDDNFLSITKAILFGRTIFKSIRKFIIFQLTVNICAVSLSIIGPFIGVQTPVTVIQMLWINMIMDTLAGLAFSFEPPIEEYMEEYPKKKNEPIINKYMKGQILFTGIYSSILCILFLKLPIFKTIFRDDNTNKYLMTAFFGLFIFMSIFNAFNARTSRINLLSNIFKNKVFLFIILLITVIQIILLYFGGEIFRTFGLTFYEFQIMLLLAMTVIPVDFIRKIYLRFKGEVGGV